MSKLYDYYIYRITSLIDGRTYVGKRLMCYWDDYYGSGEHIKNAVRKYGKENFSREILAEYRNITSNEISKIESNYIRSEWELGHGEFNHSVNSYGGDIFDGMPESMVADITRKRVESTRNGKGFSDMRCCHTKEAEKKAGISRSLYMKNNNSVERISTESARKKAMITRKLNGTNDASRINTPEAIAIRNRSFNWYYEGKVVYTGKKNTASKMMHLRNQVWEQGELVK